MKHTYTSTTYINAAERFDDACDWLSALGISYSKTRVGKYQKVMQSLARHQKLGSIEKFFEEHRFEDWVNAAHESAEIIRIHEGLVNVKDLSFVERMKEAVKGQELYVLDTENRSGRDFSLELAVAAKFCASGYRVDFNDSADIKMQFGTTALYVECKRIRSQTKVAKRLKEGLKQLHKRYVKSEFPERSRGMLAVSISKLVNAEFGILEAENDRDLGDRASAHNMKFIRQHQGIWQGGVDSRTLGVAIILDVPGVLVGNGKQLTTCHEITVNNSVHQRSKEHDLLLQVAARVFAGGT